MIGHTLKITQGYGDSPVIELDHLTLQNVKGFKLVGEAGKLPELTVTLEVASAVCRTEEQV